MGHEEHGGTWHMDAAQLDTQRKKGEAILKTSSTVHSTRPAKLQLDRAEKSTAILHMEVMEIAGKDPLRAPISLALEIEPFTLGKGWLGIEKPNIKRSLDTRSFKSR
ncbi:unnamed protein product [Microthlaspi erraticum]|uniref:Uncharacterized protein n=1 Tax=Microthlaspi erraticum TaxID=1685480 RepID=A0A6D2JSJ3_9BRAS|nr:unnamed protein product [Microthlaspi erraticum]